MNNFDSVLVLGGSGDIGRAFIEEVASSRKIIATYRTKPYPTALCFDQVQWVKFDFPSGLDVFSREMKKKNQIFDLIINCMGQYHKTLDVLCEQEFTSQLESNFLNFQSSLKILRDHVDSRSSLLNIGSIASHLGGESEFAYSANKMLVDRLMENLRRDDVYGSINLVNIRPGAVVSRMTRDRENSENFICPRELAKVALSLLDYRNTLSIPSIDVFRARTTS